MTMIYIFLWAVIFFTNPSSAFAEEKGSIEKGKGLVQGLGCVACHKVEGKGGAVGPDLTEVYGKEEELASGEKVRVTEEYLVESIIDPDAKVVTGFSPGLMPKAYTGLPKGDIDSIVAYLKSLSQEGERATIAPGITLPAQPIQQGPSTVWIWIAVGFLSGAFSCIGIYYVSRGVSPGWTVLIVLVAFIGLLGGFLWAKYPLKNSDREIVVTARQFAYDPPVIRVNKGDRVTFKVTSKDVLHGFYIDGYNVDREIRPGESVQFTFIANKEGKFGFRCSRTCGVLHPFMIGNLIVEPNYLFPASIGLAFGLAMGTLIYIAKRREGA